jgi:ArsR family transcriptional regulator
MRQMRELPLIDCCVPLGVQALSDDEAEASAALFAALADPARVRIVNIEPLGLSQPTVSHHLKRLVDAGLLEREQQGKWAYFSLTPQAGTRLAGLVDLARDREEALR